MKRFTETTKWADPWFRKLPPHLKCLWLYLCDNCDGAGVIDLDLDLVSFQIGHQVSRPEMDAFQGRIEWLDNGKLWLKKFIAFQYGKLSADCKPHAAVLALVKSHGLNSDENQRVSKGYPKGIHTLQDKDKDKEEEKETVQDKETVQVQEREKDRQDPCTEEEAWLYAKNQPFSPPWTKQAVSKWWNTRKATSWMRSGQNPCPVTKASWRHDLSSSHSWATSEPRNGGRRGKELPESETHFNHLAPDLF